MAHATGADTVSWSPGPYQACRHCIIPPRLYSSAWCIHAPTTHGACVCSFFAIPGAREQAEGSPLPSVFCRTESIDSTPRCKNSQSGYCPSQACGPSPTRLTSTKTLTRTEKCRAVSDDRGDNHERKLRVFLYGRHESPIEEEVFCATGCGDSVAASAAIAGRRSASSLRAGPPPCGRGRSRNKLGRRKQRRPARPRESSACRSPPRG